MIESLTNNKVKFLVKLKEKRTREKNKLFIVEGEHLVKEAIKKGYINDIFLLQGEENVYGKVTYVSLDVLKKITSLKNPPKVIGLCHYLEETKITGNTLIIDNLKDPGNLGTLIRSAVAFNYDTVIISKESVSIYNPKTIRATEGMLFNINIITDDLEPRINNLKEKGYIIYGTDVNNGINPSKEEKKHALIIGSESEGIRKEILKLSNKRLNIKMNDKCESLNAAISGSILMYELNK